MDIENINLDMLSGIGGNAQNNYVFSLELANLLLISQNRFKWVSTSINPINYFSEYIEKLLCFYGQCAVVKENNILKVKRCYGVGNIGKYGNPTEFTTTDYNGGNPKNYKITDSNFVWICNNVYKLPTTFWLFRYADRISHVQRVQDLNIDAQKTPYIISSTPNKLQSLRNLFKKLREISEVIFIDESKGITENVKVLNLNAPYIVDKLQNQKRDEFNNALNFLGINTIDEKQERLITNEAEISRELTQQYIDIFYQTRKRAVDEMRQKFNINIDIVKNIFYLEDENKGAI